ncbi:MAG TPA: hypothetical protein VFN70_18120 [Burkholderiales bacterium]|nr:hypothetical protein [Burkholderiales bacterium]
MSNDLNSYQMQQNMMSQGIRGQLGERITVKDPTVVDAQDAIAALRKRLDAIKTELASMKDRGPRLEAEQARIERMLEAAAPPETDQ